MTFTDLAAGAFHSVGLGADGVVYAWGRNNVGQLGDGTTVDSSVPTPVALPAEVVITAVTAGQYFSAALSADGVVYAWGSNSSGQLGDGTTAPSPVPKPVSLPPGTEITALAAGYYHVVAMSSDGGVYAWGYNSSGQLGDGTTTTSSVPVVTQVPSGVTYTELFAAGYRSSALGSDGNVYSWGDNREGQIGDGTVSNATTPVAARFPDGVTADVLSVGYNFSVATGSDGMVYAWGSNGRGQLGDGTRIGASLPVAVQTPAGVTFSAMSSGENHTVATGSDGSTYGWGWNTYGQVGNGATGDVLVPVAIPTGGVTLSAFATGFGHSLAVGSDGNTYAWGWNAYGQLGDGTTSSSSLALLAVEDQVQVLSVQFGGIAGTELTQSGGGWTVLTPAHACGPVEVLVTAAHSFGSVGEVSTTDGTFTYGTAPVVTEEPTTTIQVPASGGEISVRAAADGDDPPTIQWQQRPADGEWSDVPGATATSLTLTVTTPSELRAVFTNCLGTATTRVAAVTLAAPEPTPSPTPSEPAPTPSPTSTAPTGGTAPAGDATTLPRTGAPELGALLLAAFALIVVGAGLHGAHRRRARH
ncbi:cell wall anchor protein [Cellulomonas hominis]|uniref:Cell wall anchor protein n=1 Tax=Cellulomonas hominis TaxID=156981 RepID=A0A7Z8K3N4_9CELL|nr:RCC1 domain-containing protein [Cellulomonas hominis]TKR27319.1 cell wall anchor protein [Cellulomonas hominis]